MRKHEADVHVTGWKTFANGFFITHILNTDNINNIYIDNILTKSGEQQLMGPLDIIGDVLVRNDFQVDGDFNGISLLYLTQTFTIKDGKFVIKGD